MKKRRSSKNRKYVFLGIIVIIIIGVGVAFTIPQNNTENPNSVLLGSWGDIHGIGMFLSGDDETLYAATHQGLFKKTDLGWKRVGNDRADLMGFAINSEEAKMYSSGHSTTGNLGFRTSVDKGNSWVTVSKVKDTPVDFHAMTASPAQKGLIYGSPGHSSDLFVTFDEGSSWQLLTPPGQIIDLEADPLNPDKVYAGTNLGFYVSDNKGKQWQKINSDIEIGVITGIGFAPDGKTMYVFSSLDDKGVIYKSITGGEIMIKTQGQIPNAQGIWDFVPGRSGEVYSIVSQQLSSGSAMSVYRTNDGGDTWILEGTNNLELSLTANT
jgi:photosystem II stability/assembly factor-like uncharacterized protein